MYDSHLSPLVCVPDSTMLESVCREGSLRRQYHKEEGLSLKRSEGKGVQARGAAIAENLRWGPVW